MNAPPTQETTNSPEGGVGFLSWGGGVVMGKKKAPQAWGGGSTGAKRLYWS